MSARAGERQRFLFGSRRRRIERGCEGVTPGPWEDYEHCWFRYGVRAVGDDYRDPLVIPTTYTQVKGGAKNRPIAAHIARLDPQTVAELVRLARIGRDLEQGREQYIRGIRIHVPIGKPGDF